MSFCNIEEVYLLEELGSFASSSGVRTWLWGGGGSSFVVAMVSIGKGAELMETVKVWMRNDDEPTCADKSLNFTNETSHLQSNLKLLDDGAIKPPCSPFS